MTDRPQNKKRRKHLKNLRKVKRSKRTGRAGKTSARTRAAAVSESNPLVLLGLIISSVVFLTLIVSAFLQWEGGEQPLTPEIFKGKNLPIVEPSTVEVRVLNGCGVQGASRKMTQVLRDRRFDVVAVENAEHFGYEKTLIINHTAKPGVGLAVSRSIGCERLTTEIDELALADVSVILGRDWESFIDTRDSSGRKDFLENLLNQAKSVLGLE